MMGPVGALAARPSGQTSDVAQAPDKLVEVTEQLEGVFLQYLTRALRETVPDGGTADVPGADVYASFLDEHLAQVLADHTRTGIAEALYRQLGGGDPNPLLQRSTE